MKMKTMSDRILWYLESSDHGYINRERVKKKEEQDEDNDKNVN